MLTYCMDDYVRWYKDIEGREGAAWSSGVKIITEGRGTVCKNPP